MAIFVSTRQRFLNCFEPRDDGVAYRSSAHWRAVLVSAEERDLMVSDFDRRRVVFWVAMLATPMVIGLVAVAAYAVGLSPTISAAAPWLAFFIYPCLLSVWSTRAGSRLIRGRPYIDEGLPKAEAERREARDMSWIVLALPAFTTPTWCWSVLTLGDMSPIWRISLLVIGVVTLAQVIRDVRFKFRYGRAPKPSGTRR